MWGESVLEHGVSAEAPFQRKVPESGDENEEGEVWAAVVEYQRRLERVQVHQRVPFECGGSALEEGGPLLAAERGVGAVRVLVHAVRQLGGEPGQEQEGGAEER